RTFEVLGDKVTPSDEAKQALETLFGSASDIDAAQRLSRPKAPLSVGESFAIDGPPFAKAYLGAMPVDAAKAVAKGTLVEVNGGKAKIHYELSAPLLQLPTGLGQPAIDLDPGATMKSAWDETWALDGRIRLSLAEGKTTQAGTA